MTTNHPYHLVQKSPWPLTTSLAAMYTTTGLIKWFNTTSMNLMIMGLSIALLSTYQWWRDVSREASLLGDHCEKVKMGLRIGMVLFIASEVMLFFSFFWAFFHSALSTTMEIGNQWPPTSLQTFEPTQVPLLNTSVLLASGTTVTWAHHATLASNQSQTNQGLTLTVLLGLYFTSLQALEYYQASFSISDSIYGASFFLFTGFHGLHVIVGSLFLMSTAVRLNMGQLAPSSHFGLEAAIWYWHFVDVVWLILYTAFYWWGS